MIWVLMVLAFLAALSVLLPMTKGKPVPEYDCPTGVASRCVPNFENH